MKKLVLTHANCVDGCCSHAILETLYGNDAHYVAVEWSIQTTTLSFQIKSVNY